MPSPRPLLLDRPVPAWLPAVALVALTASLLTSACRDRSAPEGNGSGSGAPLQVVATVGIFADVVRELGGDCVQVEALMGPGVDPHLYRASAGDLDLLGGAELIVYGGMLLEGKMEDVLSRMGQRTSTLALLETLAEDELLSLPDSAGHHDPHLWNDPALFAQTFPAIEARLAELRPACAEAVRANGERYGAQVVALDGWAREAMATVPEGQRVLVTAHDAFAYFGRAYGLEVHGIQGVSTESEASVADIRNIADLIVERRVPALFVESSVNPRNIEAVQAAAQARGWSVSTGASLFSDAMGDDGTAEGTYLGMVRANVSRVVEALGGTVPPLPEALSAWAEGWNVQ